MYLLKKALFACFMMMFFSCREEKKPSASVSDSQEAKILKYAKGFTIEKSDLGITVISITSPWPNAESIFRYALVPREVLAKTTLNKEAYDAIITVPVKRIVVTSTTHIPALEALGEDEKLIAFPDTQYISSEKTRKRVESGKIKELGNNEALNTEKVIELNPDLVIGFSISGQNKAYKTIRASNIPIVYNGDWTEETPLGKAEWIKFFAPFFKKEKEAERIFNGIEKSYLDSKKIAASAEKKPIVISGALYKDVWYTPGGKSWAAQFLKDANAQYLWESSVETGSLSLSWEAVLEAGQHSDFWIGPAQFTSYADLKETSLHYTQFDAFKTKKIFTFANTKGATGGLLYYELAPQRPDIVLKDLIHIVHPELLPDYRPFFFKPLD